ncbi:uncharacterized protein PG998_006320 [Apiospora kogelbergensis]|uniref:uncharacterized protein n=1 Tax=Apiospora kogelbergensis TaxID=1337665 RepID=UPI00312E543E
MAAVTTGIVSTRMTKTAKTVTTKRTHTKTMQTSMAGIPIPPRPYWTRATVEDDSSDEESANRLRLPNAMKRHKPVHTFRRRPDPATYEPLARDFVAAVVRGSMPRLQSAQFWMREVERGTRGASLTYAVPGAKRVWWNGYFEERSDEVSKVRQAIFWTFDRSFFSHNPRQEILDEWRKWLGPDGSIFQVGNIGLFKEL